MPKPSREVRKAVSKKSHSWWWDSHISPKNSKWLAENLEEMDLSVKQMLKLIEEDADSFAKKAEMYYAKRPELVSHVEDFYRRYRSLAERYDHVTGELRKNIPSELQSQGSGSDFGCEPRTPSPESKPAPRSSHRAAGFDLFLGSGATSDLSSKESDASHSSSDSGSEYDEAISGSHLLLPLENGFDVDNLHQRIYELECELESVKEKLKATQDENSKTVSLDTENGNYDDLQMKVLGLEQQLVVANEKLQHSEEEVAKLKYELENLGSLEIISDLEAKLESSIDGKAMLESELDLIRKEIQRLEAELEASRKENVLLDTEFGLERKRVLEMEEQVMCLEADVAGHKKTIEEMRVMQERVRCLQADVAGHTKTIEEMKVSIADATKKHSEEKLAFEAEISGLLETRMETEEMLRELNSKIMSLTESVVKLEADNLGLQAELDLSNSERTDSCRRVEELNLNLDALNLKYDSLEAERDELRSKVEALVADVRSRDDQILNMDKHLQQLHIQHAKLIAGSEMAQKFAAELQMKVKELEDEVERQRGVISDNAEAKREVIRQLCFSLDHYRDEYLQLRQALHGHKRPTLIAA